MLIKITLIDTSLSTLDLDDLKVLITKEPFKYEIIVSNSSDKTTSKETISENISCIKQLDLPISSVTEAIDDSINYAVEPEITSVISDDKNLIQEKTVEVSPEDLKEKLQSEDFKDDNSIIKLESLLKEVNDMIDSSCDDNLEVIQNSLDEVQTIIMKMKSDFDGSIDDSINETLEDLECNVRSFQLQIIEHSPQVLLKEACVHLQTLVTHISKLNEVEEVLKPTTIKVANDVLDECSNDARQTIECIEKVSSSGSTQHLEHIISNLNQIKDLLKSLRLKFLTNADTLIMGGVETVQSLDQIEERIFCLEKDLESQKNVDPITRDNIISAVHCVYGSISNMRGTISCVQKKYMYENYGKPSRYFLTSIKNVMELVKKEKHTKHWKQFAQSLRKVLNHFEDIKFYINFDKTARLPGDAAFTKIILGELVSVLSNEVVQDVGSLDPEVIKNVYDCIKCINRKLSDIEKNTILEVKEKIPIFNDLSIKILDLTKNINKFMQNEMMIENDKDKVKSDLTPSLLTNLDKENMNEEETDKNTKTDNIKLLFKDNVNNELTQTLPEIIEKSENANILQHQVESEVLQSNENKKMPTNTDFEDKYIVQTEEILLEKEIFSQSDINLMEENNTDIHAKEKIEIDFPETTCEKEVSKENQEKTSGSHLLVKNHTMLQNTDHQKSSEIVSNDKNDKHDNQVDLENNNAEKQTWYQETKQVEEGKICDKGEKQVISDVDEKKESSKIKDYEENGSESKDQSKNFESKKQDEQQKEAMLIIEGKVEESINTFVENGNIPKDKSTPHKKKSNEQSNKYDNGEEQNIANVEENKELIKSLGNEENNTGNEVQFKKDFKKQEQKHQETQLSIDSAVQETVNTSVENADIPCDMSKPHEMKPVKKSEISDDVIANVKEKQECVKDMEKKDDEKSNTGKEDQFKKELKEQEQQQIESVSTIESKVAESVNSSVEHLDTLTEKSKPQETKKIVQSTICDNDEKQVFTNLEEKKEVIQESETKDYGERSFDKEDKFKKEQEQQQIESVSTIDSKVSESVNTTVEHIDTPTEKSKHQETKKIVESTIYDNDKKQVIINLEEKTEVIKESGTKDYGERSSDKEDQFKKEFIEQEQQQIESEATINSKVAESVNTTVEHIDTPTEKSKPQEMKQVVESTICDINEKQVPREVEEKTEVINELEIKEYGEISSGKKDQFKKELKEHEQQQIENVATIESKLAESVNTSTGNINMPIDKSKPQEMKQIIESAICDNNEKQVITNLEEKAEVIRELGTKEYGERSSDKEDQFKKKFKEQQLQQIESVSTIESIVTESVNSSVEHIDARTEKSKPQERKQIAESTIGDNDEKQDIINVEEKTEVIKELATREYGESSSSKDDQFKKEHKVQEQQEIANVVTTESKGEESVNTSVEHINKPTEKSKSQEMKQIVESKICDNDEKQIITEVEEKTEVIKESGTKEYGERRSDHEDQFKKELNDQEQQQMESVSTIESKVAESVNTSGENINMPIEESKPQEMNQIIENTICDNGEKQDITNVEEKTEAIKEMATKEYGESSSSKDDQFQKEHKEMKQIVESKICDNDEKQVITKVKEKTEVIKESGTKDYGERNSDKEDQFKKGLNEQEQQQIESEATIESKAAESVNTTVEHIVMTTDIFQPQGMKQVVESTICDDGKKQVTANINETEESIKTTEIREYEVSSTSEDDQYKKEYEEQKQQQKKSISTIESTVPESLNDSAENINMPLEKSTIKNGNEKCIEEVTNVIKSFEEIAEFQTQENNSVLSNIETKEDFVKEKAETGKEIKKHLVESFYQEKSSDNQDRNTEKHINKAMETSSDYDNLYVQVQEEVEKDDESKIESKQKKCLIEKKDDTKSIEVSQTLTYKDDSTEAQVLQQEITEINDTKNDKKLDAVENVNTININSKHKIVLEIDTEKQPSEVDIVTERQDELLYEEDVESANSNEHIIKQDRFDILDLSQPKEKENNQDVSKIKDNKNAIANIDIPVQLHIDDKIKEGTLNQIDNKTSTEHIDNEHTQKEMKNKAETKKEEQNLIKEEMKDSKLKKSLDAKQVGYSDLEEKMRENIRKTKVEIITDLGEIDQEVTSLKNFLQNEENAEIKIETDPFRHDIDVRSDFSVKESITQVASKSEDELKVSTHKLEQNSSYLIEDTCCKKMENNTDSERSEFKEDINQNIDKSSIIKEYFEINLEKKTENGNKILDKVIDSDDREHPINITDVSLETSNECKDKENLTEMKKNKEICSKSQNIQLENDLSKENKEINDNKQETIKTKQNKKVIKNQDNESQSKAATVKKDEAEINIDKKQESISLLNKDYETEVKILSDVDNQSNPNIIDTNLHVANQQVLKQSNESLKGDKNNLSKEDISNLKKQEENIDNIINLEHLQVDKHTQILEQTQQLEAVFDNVENSEKLIKHTQEHLKGKEELKSQEQVQAKLLTKEISEREEGKTSARKQQKEKRRVKKLPETSKQEADVKSEVKPQETENNDLDKGKKIDEMNLNVVNVELPSTKAEDGNDIFIKEGKQNQDKQETIEQKNIDIQHNKLETKMSNKFPYEEEVENKKETDKLTRQINEKEIIQRNENKKEYAKELNRKERQDSDEENKIKDQHNSEEKVITDKYFEKIKDYDIIKQLKDGTTSIKKDIREVQKSNEERKMNTIADSILTNVESEFCIPPVYVAKPYGIEDTVSQIQINNNKAQTIYKAQTLRHESQLRYSMPPHIDKALNTIEGRSQIKENNKAASECRSTLSEKRCSSSRYIKRKPVFSTFLTDRTAVESSRVKLTCSVLTNIDPRITWYKNGVQLENKHKFRSKFVDGLITLEILNALPSDSGEYSCSVENENGLVTSSANLKVYPSFEASPIPPTFTRSIRDNYHLAENELVLECRIRGQPLPTITWLKNDKPIISERYQAHYLADGVCRLTISNPTTEDSGKYTCKAESSVWSDEITHDVYFTGKKSPAGPNIATAEKLHFSRLGLESRRPHFTNVLSDHKVVTGGTIGLQVEIRGSPTRVEWLREGHSVTELYRNAQTYVDHDIYTLALSDVTEKESGLYTCRAYSNQGNVDMNASITVVQPNQYDGKPASIISRPEKDVIISVGEDLNISFRVYGEPKAKVFFMKGIRDLSNSQRVCKMTSDDYVKFTLKRTVVSDAGTYCIFAKNAYGCDRAFVTVVIRQRASSDNLISDWTYPMDDLAISSLDRNYKSVPDRIPSEPSVVDGGNNWISLAWPKSDHQSRAPILAYKVESWLLGKEGGARWAELGITPRNSFDAFNLKQGEEYHFRVTPRNRYGWGESVQTSVPIGIGLAGDRPEFVEILPGQLKVLVGEKAILRCSFTGKPMPEIVWMKNGHEIEEEIGRVTIQINNFQTSLQIEEVKINDEGRYSCEATNIHGRTSTYARMAVISDRQIWQADAKLKRERSAGIDGEYPPQFTMRLRDRRVQATYPVRLTCQVVGNPSPVVKWFKNEEEVIIGGRYTASQDEYFYTLEIAPTTLEDGGVYEAMARNGCGAVSCRCSLVVDKGIRAYIAPEFCCGLEPLYRLSEGEELRISAIVEAYPSVGVTWYRDGVRLRPSRRAIMTLDRDGQIELALASVTGRDAGVYTCTASNEVGMASTSGKVEILSGEYVIEKGSAPPIVISSDVPYSKEPMFIRKPRSSEAREGDTVIIECEVTGDPKPDVYWLRDFLKPDYYRDSSHFKRIGAGPAYRFEIPHAKLDYTGAYSIVAKNIHGETKAIISLQILAKDPTCGDDVHNIKYGRVEVIPRFVKELTDLLCYDGDAVEFECSVSGNPDPDIRWFHYNEIIPECPDFETSYDVGTARLKIKQVTAEDEGTYTCEASNGLGKASSSACLVVYPPGEPNTLSTRLRRPPALLSAASTPRSTPRTTPARSMSRTPGPEPRRLCSPSREIAPKFYTYPFNRVAEEGDTVVFQCAVKGLPQPWATWDKDGIIITPSARITIKEKDEMLRILEIEQVTIEDVGLYRISLENDYGRAEASARLEVITQKGKFYGSTRSFSVSPRKTLPYRRRTPSFSK
ncbi:unnamed protein product [Euphydryas editha]|uniref:Uncharacterized protein n=1 Tax=Euphydryas editha TaxID=104508 RepID=A0AAU9V0H8_EUPED|nr:unnamed protein product [Euphydryas editha]